MTSQDVVKFISFRIFGSIRQIQGVWVVYNEWMWVSPLALSNQKMVESACQMSFNHTCSLKEYIMSYQLHTQQLRLE